MGLADVRHEIDDACRGAGRKPSSVTLVAVSKFQPVEKISAIIDAGQMTFGENRVQEAAEKFPPLRERHSGIVLHMVGRLQTNKVKDAVRVFDAIETVDSLRLAAALGEEMRKQSRSLPCFVQVNTGDEPQKGGIAPEELERLLAFCRDEAGLNIIGLMCIPPAHATPETHFTLLRELAEGFDLPCLSMGMSDDFARAIRCGATHIRVGTAIFGPRS